MTEELVGTSYVPQTGLALLHRGEKIIPAGQVDEYVPIGERCYAGCRRRAVVNDGGMFCARCWLARQRRQ